MNGDFIPNCVPEYFREQQEKYERECELYWQRLEHFKENKKKMKEAYEAGLPILSYGGFEACWNCKDADHDTQTFAEDDFDCVICHNPDCAEHGKHKE